MLFKKDSLKDQANSPSEIGWLNESWAHQIVKSMIFYGVRLFCVAPGSRSTPLAVAVAQHPLAESVVHFDERSLAYFALGWSKASGNPVCVITTSGSAAANLHPALIEASMQHIPLVFITADRPPELRETGANQTIDQVKMFGTAVRWFFDLPCPDFNIPHRFIESTIGYAVYKSLHAPAGPVHLNCMFREPFLSDTFQEKNHLDSPLKVSHKPNFYISESSVNTLDLDQIAEDLSLIKKGIMIVGSHPCNEMVESLFALAKKLQWPILSETLSEVRTLGRENYSVPYHELIIKQAKEFSHLQPEAVIHLGDQLVSKEIFQWLGESEYKIYVQVAHHPNRYDPYKLTTHRFECNPFEFCDKLSELLPHNTDTQWLDVWKDFSKKTETGIHDFFQKSRTLSEMQLMRLLCDELDPSTCLFLANSMPVRDANALFYPIKKVGPAFSNRGHSGIDGNIATAIGISRARREKCVAVLGDQTFLHDVGSLALLKDHEYPMTFIIINNFGGGIFSFFPISQKKDILEKFFAAAHQWQFKAVAELFDIRYFQPKTLDQFLNAMQKCREQKAHSIIEIHTDREENAKEHKDLLASLKQQYPNKLLKKCYPFLLKEI